MHDEDDFLRKLAETPADDTIRLVYADWLQERGDKESLRKARFLRLTVRSRDPKEVNKFPALIRNLAARLPTDWLAVVSRLKIENCGAKQTTDPDVTTIQATTLRFDFVCDKRWDEMTPTSDSAVRLCDACQSNVHYCDTIVTAREHAAEGHCVAVDLGIIRHKDDLSPPVMMLGLPSLEWLVEERKRLEVDAVSREREERKRQNAE